MPEFFSTRDVADLLGTDTWRVRRLYEDHTLSEPGRVGGKRVISRSMIPIIAEHLRQRGWLRVEPEALTK